MQRGRVRAHNNGKSGQERVVREEVVDADDEGSSCRIPGEQADRCDRRVAQSDGSRIQHRVQASARSRVEVFAVNPNADEVEGAQSYHDLKSIPGGVDAVVIATAPDKAEGTMRECDELGIKQVWMHRSYGAGSVSDSATAYGREHGITVIDGGCPLMFEPTADFGHKVMRVIYRSHMPKTV